MPHVGHADSITNDKHRSWSDISDWSSSNPVTRVIKVTLPTPTIFFIRLFIHLLSFKHSYTHSHIHSYKSFIHPTHPKHLICS